jgi:hypothetical protein
MIAAVAAAMFAALEPASPVGENGESAGPASIPSNWKQKGRSEALR